MSTREPAVATRSGLAADVPMVWNLHAMALGPSRRLSVTLDAEHAVKLARMAERAQMPAGTLARDLLSAAIEAAPPEPREVIEILDGIPGAWDRIAMGLEQARLDETIDLYGQ